MIREQGTVELGHCVIESLCHWITITVSLDHSVIVFRDGQAQEESFSGSGFQDFRQPVFS